MKITKNVFCKLKLSSSIKSFINFSWFFIFLYVFEKKGNLGKSLKESIFLPIKFNINWTSSALKQTLCKCKISSGLSLKYSYKGDDSDWDCKLFLFFSSSIGVILFFIFLCLKLKNLLWGALINFWVEAFIKSSITLGNWISITFS